MPLIYFIKISIFLWTTLDWQCLHNMLSIFKIVYEDKVRVWTKIIAKNVNNKAQCLVILGFSANYIFFFESGKFIFPWGRKKTLKNWVFVFQASNNCLHDNGYFEFKFSETRYGITYCEISSRINEGTNIYWNILRWGTTCEFKCWLKISNISCCKQKI